MLGPVSTLTGTSMNLMAILQRETGPLTTHGFLKLVVHDVYRAMTAKRHSAVNCDFKI